MAETSTQIYHLLLSPPQDELLAVVHELAKHLLGTSRDGWSDPVEEASSSGTHWVSTQGDARLRMREPTDAAPGFLELLGFGDDGRVRWVMGEPPRLILSQLRDDVIDLIWARMRAQQADALRQWVRTRGSNTPVRTGRPIGGFGNLFRVFKRSSAAGPIPCELPFLSKPPFAPDDAPIWVFKGELSSLPREVDAIGHPVAGIAYDEAPSERLLVRSVHRLGAQSVIPLLKLPRGHRPIGGTAAQRGFATMKELGRAVVEPIDRYLGAIGVGVPDYSMDRDTDRSAVWLTRFQQIEQTDIYPFRLSGGVAKVPRSDVTVRLLEVRTAFAPKDGPEAIAELSIDGLPEGAQVHVTATQHRPRAGAAPEWRARSFVIGPPEKAEDLRLLVERGLG